jgi:hypothetical protein
MGKKLTNLYIQAIQTLEMYLTDHTELTDDKANRLARLLADLKDELTQRQVGYPDQPVEPVTDQEHVCVSACGVGLGHYQETKPFDNGFKDGKVTPTEK